MVSEERYIFKDGNAMCNKVLLRDSYLRIAVNMDEFGRDDGLSE